MSAGYARGVALAIVLVLLLGLGLLALAGMGGVAASLALAGMAEQHASAFESAEGAISRVLRQWPVVADEAAAGHDGLPGSVALRIEHDPVAVPGVALQGFSIGDGADGFRLRCVTVTAQATALRGAAAHVEQTFITLGAAE